MGVRSLKASGGLASRGRAPHGRLCLTVMGVGAVETSGVNEAMEECELVAQRLVIRPFV